MVLTITGILIGIFSMATGIAGGFYLCMYSLRKGAQITDNIYHDKAPFDEELTNEELPSHVDGVNMDEEE